MRNFRKKREKMINKSVPLQEITFEKTEVDPDFLESVRTRGIAIPVKVIRTDEGYVCRDGNRRLSAAAVLARDDSRFVTVPVMIVNDFSKAGSAYWGNTKNRH